MVALWLLAGCSAGARNSESANGAAPALSPEQCVGNAEIIRASTADHGYVIQPGDELNIDFYLNSEFNQDVLVRPDGRISLRLVGVTKAAGMTPQQLAQELDRAYSSELRDPGAAVTVKNMPSRQVFVDGQVAKPGAFPLEPGMTALQAVTEAGGLTGDASDEAVLIRRHACGVPQGAPIDLASAADNPGKGEDVALQSRDIIVVPRSTIANMDLFVEHYIRGLMPMQPYMAFTAPVP